MTTLADHLRPIRINVPCVPIAQPRPRAVAIGGHARVYEAPSKHAIHAYKATVHLAAKQAYGGPQLEGPLSLVVLFVFPRPGRLRWKKREMPRAWHFGKPDGDNCLKSTLDALRCLWRDDSQIAHLRCWKIYAAGHEQPHVEIDVSEIGLEEVPQP